MPEGHGADALRAIILSRFDMSLSNGAGVLEGRVFWARHFGHWGDLQLIGRSAGEDRGPRGQGAASVPRMQAAIKTYQPKSGS
jgi:alanine-glyoxylate transaminase/serine-glyoxylate transaminase/serine-pyruvate transaminase